MTAEERFAKRFGQLQRELGDDIVSFYQDVGELPRGSLSSDQTVFWMDDQRTMAILTVCGPDGKGDIVAQPTSLWQYIKSVCGLEYEANIYPVLHCSTTGTPRGDADVRRWTRHLEEQA